MPRTCRSRDIAAAVGTPFYVYSAASLHRALPRASRRASRRIDAADLLRGQGQLQPRRAAAAGRGSGPAPTSSRRASCGARSPPACPPQRIVFSGVGKTAAEIAAALAAGIRQINVESVPELRRAQRGGRARVGATAPVAIRVNPDVDALTHAKIATGKKENKFGIDIDEAREAYAWRRRCRASSWSALAVHIGSPAHRARRRSGAPSSGRRAGRRAARRGLRVAGSISAAASASATARETPAASPADYAALVREVIRRAGASSSRSSPAACWSAPAGLLVAAVDLRQGRANDAVRDPRRGDERPDAAGDVRRLARHRAGARAGAGAALEPGRRRRADLRDRRHLRRGARAAAARRGRPGRVYRSRAPMAR